MLASSGYRKDAFLLIALALVIIIPYSAWDDWAGGFSFGPRFLIPALPFLMIPIAYLLGSAKSRSWYIAYFILFVASSLFQGSGAIIDATPSDPNNLLYFQPLQSILSIYHGDFGYVYWAAYIEISRNLARISAAAIFLSLWLLTGLFCYKALRETSNAKQTPMDAKLS